jgi:acyl-CoA synthetase (AMP-forming)/AMP-acid ligase II
MIARLVHERLLATPDRIALRDEARAWTAGELDEVARAWAGALRSSRRVGLMADNGLELAGVLLGALYAGVAVVPFHAGTPADELAARVARFDVDVLVSDRAPALGVRVLGLEPPADANP